MRTNALVLSTIALLLLAASGRADDLPKEIDELRFDQKLGEQVPLELTFVNEEGQTVQLKDYFQGKPVILVLAYYRCPRLCSQVIGSLVEGLRVIPQQAGKDFHVVIVSFDPRETPQLAAANKKSCVELYGRPGGEAGWHCLTGKKENIKKLADAVGFRFTYDAQRNLYSHASGIMMLTPEGKVGRYLFGLDYPPKDLRLGIAETSEGKLGALVENVLLLTCLAYDPSRGQYTMSAMKLMRSAAVLTVLLLGGYMLWSYWRYRRSPSLALQAPMVRASMGAASLKPDAQAKADEMCVRRQPDVRILEKDRRIVQAVK